MESARSIHLTKFCNPPTRDTLLSGKLGAAAARVLDKSIDYGTESFAEVAAHRLAEIDRWMGYSKARPVDSTAFLSRATLAFFAAWEEINIRGFALTGKSSRRVNVFSRKPRSIIRRKRLSFLVNKGRI